MTDNKPASRDEALKYVVDHWDEWPEPLAQGQYYPPVPPSGWLLAKTEDGMIIVSSDGRLLMMITRDDWLAAQSKSETPAWDGEDRPPVGARVLSPSGEAVVDYSGPGIIVYTNNDGQWSVRTDAARYTLSPIKSEADRRRDDAVLAMLFDDKTLSTEQAESLVDAGWQKVNEHGRDS